MFFVLAFVLHSLVCTVTSLSTFQLKCMNNHNALRALHGAPALEWSQPLANSAQRWAEHLAEIDQLKHAPPTNFGENLFYMYGGDPKSACDRAVKNWYAEIKNYDFSKPKYDKSTGLFTQLVWKGTTHVGIGFARSSTGNFFLVARYSPPGNVQQDKISENVKIPSINQTGVNINKLMLGEGFSASKETPAKIPSMAAEQLPLPPSNQPSLSQDQPPIAVNVPQASLVKQGEAQALQEHVEQKPPIKIETSQALVSVSQEDLQSVQQDTKPKQTPSIEIDTPLQVSAKQGDVQQLQQDTKPFLPQQQKPPIKIETTQASGEGSQLQGQNTEPNFSEQTYTGNIETPVQVSAQQNVLQDTKTPASDVQQKVFKPQDATYNMTVEQGNESKQQPNREKAILDLSTSVDPISLLAGDEDEDEHEQDANPMPIIQPQINPLNIGKDFEVSITIMNEQFTDELQFPQTKQFIELARKVLSALNILYDDNDDYREAQVISFRRGDPVTADIGLIFYKNSSHNLDPLSNALQTGRISKLPVGNNFVQIEALPDDVLKLTFPFQPQQDSNDETCPQSCSNLCLPGCESTCCGAMSAEIPGMESNSMNYATQATPETTTPVNYGTCPESCSSLCSPGCDPSCCGTMSPEVTGSPGVEATNMMTVIHFPPQQYAPAAYGENTPLDSCSGWCQISCTPDCSADCCRRNVKAAKKPFTSYKGIKYGPYRQKNLPSKYQPISVTNRANKAKNFYNLKTLPAYKQASLYKGVNVYNVRPVKAFTQPRKYPVNNKAVLSEYKKQKAYSRLKTAAMKWFDQQKSKLQGKALYYQKLRNYYKKRNHEWVKRRIVLRTAPKKGSGKKYKMSLKRHSIHKKKNLKVGERRDGIHVKKVSKRKSLKRHHLKNKIEH